MQLYWSNISPAFYKAGFIGDAGFVLQAVATTFGINDYISWLLPLVIIKQIWMDFYFFFTVNTLQDMS